MFGRATKLERDPMLDLLYRLERRMGRFFPESFALVDWAPPGEAVTGAWMPVVDIVEEPTFIRLVAEVPGVKPEDVQITVEDNVLTIKGKKEQIADDKADQVHRFERTYGAFERTFTLPTTVAADQIKATYEHGVLSIVLPKVPTAKAQTIHVEVAPPEKALT